MNKKNRGLPALNFGVLLLCAVLFLLPFFILLINSVKPLRDITLNPLAMPHSLVLTNFSRAWKVLSIPLIMRNSAIITFSSVLLIILFSSMATYWMERHPTLFSRILNVCLITSLLIPFASLMIPLVKTMHLLRFDNTLGGVILCFVGMGVAFASFIFRGAVRSLPVELEESASIDGCGSISVFFHIVFPLLTPAVTSVFVMDIFWVWNDFLIQQTLLNSNTLLTIPVAINRMFGQYSSQWDIALAGLVICILPILIVFIFLQKKIIGGIAAGAVKG